MFSVARSGYQAVTNAIWAASSRIVHSVSGAVGSVTGNVGGNVVGNVNGNVNGDLLGTVGSVVGNVGGLVAGTVGGVAGNVAGSVAGSVGSVVAPVTVGANTDKLGYSLSTTSPGTINNIQRANGTVGAGTATDVAISPVTSLTRSHLEFNTAGGANSMSARFTSTSNVRIEHDAAANGSRYAFEVVEKH